MADIEDKVDRWDHEWLQQQVYNLQDTVRDLESTVNQLQMEVQILHNDLNTIKLEGCWRFVEDPQHTHRKNNE